MTQPGLRAMVDAAARLLDDAGVGSPRHDAMELAAFALGVDRLDVIMPPALPEGFAGRFAELVDRRRRREPLQHITGSTVFRYVTLQVAPGVFVPRPETEVVAQVAIDEAARLAARRHSVPDAAAHPSQTRSVAPVPSSTVPDAAAPVPGHAPAPSGLPLVVDLCCGAGGIAVSVDIEVPSAQVVAIDASPEAVALTTANSAACRVTATAVATAPGGNALRADRPGQGGRPTGAASSGTNEADAAKAPMRVERGDVRDPELLADLDGRVDVVVSNPPYIPPDAVPVDPEVRDHDPDLALYGGGLDGLDIPRAVIEAARRLLIPGGLFVMEHAEVQDVGARDAVAATGGFEAISTINDLTGRPRAVVARRRVTGMED